MEETGMIPGKTQGREVKDDERACAALRQFKYKSHLELTAELVNGWQNC